MNDEHACPPTEELEQLLHESLPEHREQQCVAHLDDCACCQAKLEDLAHGGTNLPRLVERLHAAAPGATSAYWPALRAVNASIHFKETAPEIEVRRRETSLTFLQPPTDPAYLGRLGHFDVMRILGRGGMGVVLEAFDTKLQRNVALKVLDPELANDETARQRFCREARAAASVTHENVVAVHQVEKSSDGGLPFLVMQLIAGETLEQRLLREKSLPVKEIVRIALQAAQGLAAAHAQGLTHRDIKPGNILLEPPGDRVKLTDFGLARVVDDVKITRSGFVTGTPLYMSPEQAMGEPTDHRSDLFSLGAVLYEMCAGRPPFQGNSALAVLKRISETQHQPLREVNPEIPDWLAETVDDLLAKKPQDRYQSAAELVEVLEYVWTQMKASSTDLPTVCQEEVKRRASRTRILIGVAGTGLLALGVLLGMALSRGRIEKAIQADPATAASVLAANVGSVWSVAFDPKADALAMALEDGSVRLWNWPTQTVQSTFDAHRGVAWASQFSPDGDLVVTAGDDGLLKVWRPSEAAPVKVFQHPSAVRGLAVSNDGKFYTGDRQGGLHVWSLDRDEALVTAQQPGAVYAVAISGDGQTLATAGSDKVIRLWNPETLQPRLRLEGHSGPVYGLSFSNDNRSLASAGWDHVVRVWDTGSGSLLTSWDSGPGDLATLAFSPDGARLATAGQDGMVQLWDPTSGALFKEWIGHKSAVHALAFSRDGSLLASGGRDGAARVWRVRD